MERGLARTAGGYKTAFGQDESIHYIMSETMPSDEPSEQPQKNVFEAIGDWFQGVGRGTMVTGAALTGVKGAIGVPESKAGFFRGIVGADESESEYQAAMRAKQARLRNMIENEKKGIRNEKMLFHLIDEKGTFKEYVSPQSELHAELLAEHHKRYNRTNPGLFGFLSFGGAPKATFVPEPDPTTLVSRRSSAASQSQPTGAGASQSSQRSATTSEADESVHEAGAKEPEPRPVTPDPSEPDVPSDEWKAPEWQAPRVFFSHPGPLTEEDELRIMSPPKPPPPKPTAAQRAQRAMLATPQGWLKAYNKQQREDKAQKKTPAAYEYADPVFRGPTADMERSAQDALAKKQPKVLQRNQLAAKNDIKARSEMLSHDDLMKMYAETAKTAASSADKPRSRSKLPLASLGKKRAPDRATGARLEDVVATPDKAAAAAAGSGLSGFLTGEFWFKAAIDPKEHIDWKDSNVAGIGSEEDKALRKMAAKTEPAWEACGLEPGVEIWRIEQFKVVPWPKEEYGKFYNADSYIILHTREVDKDPEDGYGEDGGPLGKPGLAYAIYFWLGKYTSIDKQGTAAYKTVELDDLMDQAARQHREVMEYESEAFRALFPNLMYLEGGTESGFRSVCDIDLHAYVARLLQVKKYGSSTVVVEVPCTRDSLNHGDAFVLDKGDMLYAWSGNQSTSFERAFARMAAEELERARAGKAVATSTIDKGFWETLGGYGPIKSRADAGEALPQPVALGDGVLYKLSDKTGQLYLTEVHRGALNVEMLLPQDVYICDPGTEVIVWVGQSASDRERRAAMLTATKYLALQGKPHSTPIKVFKSTADAMTDSSFAQIFAGTDTAYAC